jgi:hypothetical protein
MSDELRESDDILEDLLKSLENIIDAQDDMWEEEKYSNYREIMKIRSERLVPAKSEFKSLLDSYVDKRIESFVRKNYIQTHKFLDSVDLAKDI